MAIPPLNGNISVIETPDGKSYRIRDMVTYATLGEMATAMREKVDCKTNADSFYGTCTTAAATAAKVVSLNIDKVSGDYTATDDNFSLRPGVTISVKFTNTNTANNPTLNVSSTGAKPIWYGSAAITTSSLSMAGYANRVSSFVYDGAHWVWTGAGVDNNTTYTNMTQTEASAGTVTTGRVISAKVLNTTIEEHTAEINAVLPELVNDGAKNWLEVPDFVETVNGITFIAYRGVIHATGTATADASIAIYPKDSETGIGAAGVDIVVSGCTNGTATTYRCFLQEKTNNTYTTRVTLTNTPVEYHMSNVLSNYRYLITVYSGCTVNNKMFKPMVCTKAAWDISNVFFPYAKTNPELTICEAQDRDAIIETIDDGAKNLLKITASSETINGITFTVNADGTVVANGTATANTTFFLAALNTYDLPVGKYILSGCTGGSATTYDLRFWQAGSTKVNYDEGTEITVGSGDWNYAILIRSGQTVSNLVFKPMICTKAEWDISQEYVPYALPNPKLTAAAIEVIDNGPKNLLNHTAYTRTVNKVTYTVNADRSIQISSAGNNTQSLLYLVQNYTGVPAGNYVLSGCTGGSATTYDLRVKVGSSAFYINYDGGTEFFYNGTDSFEASIVVRASQTVNITMKPMICTKADWNVSQVYQPYRFEKVSLQQAYSDGILIATNANLNDYTTAGLYYATIAVASTLTNTPYKTTGFRLVVEKNSLSGAAVFQTIVPTSQTGVSMMYKRVYENNGWGNWLKFNAALDVIPSGTTLQAFADSLPLGAHHCFYNSANNASDAPVNTHAMVDIHKYSSTTGDITFNPISTTYHNRAYRKILSSGTWRTWQEFVGGTAKLTLENNANLNDYTYACEVVSPSAAVSATIQNTPWTASGFSVKTVNYITDSAVFQFLLPNTTTGKWYRRRYGSGTWADWVEFDAAAEEVILGPGTEIIGTSAKHQDLNNYTTPGVYYCRSNTNAGYVDNKPLGGSGFRLTVENISGTNTFRQTFIKPTEAGKMYVRHYSTSTWSSWYVFEGTVLT